MEWKNLEKKGEAPKQGWLLAYTREKVSFHSYDDIGEVEEELSGAELLELHLFNQEKEYRCLATRSKRFPKGKIETVEDFTGLESAIYAERIRLSKSMGGGGITVLNHIRYNEKNGSEENENEEEEENGMAIIDNYRLTI